MFQNKVIVVTGGAGGIGKCICEEFRREDATVCVIDSAPGDHFVGDIGCKETLEAFAASVIEAHGKVDVLVNNAPPTFLGANSQVTHSAFNRGGQLDGVVENSVLAPNCVVAEGAKVSYSVLLPGTVVEADAVVEYAILGENCSIGAGCHVGGAPDGGDSWGLTVLAPGCKVEAGKNVAPGIMLDRNGEEVSKK